MALAMPRRSVRPRTGVYRVNVRVPADLRDKVQATRLARPNGLYLTAFEINSDFDQHGITVKLDDVLEVLFGADADRLCAERNLILDAATRRTLLREVAQRFPAYEPRKVELPRRRPHRRTSRR